MVGRRWIRMLGSGVVVMGALGMLVASTPAPGMAGPWIPADCVGGGAARLAVASAPRPATMDDVAGTPWFRLDPVIDATGDRVGSRLWLGINGARQDRAVDLPAAAFGAGPFGGLVLVGSDDGTRSRVESFDVGRGCRSTVAVSTDVIRSATIDPDGTAIYEHRVDRGRRTDLGVWRRALDGSSGSQRVLAPVGPDDRFGRTWTTGLTWSAEGDRLVVQSCAAVSCRTRLLAIATGRVTAMADPALGLLVGVSGDRLVTHLACRGLPCPLVTVDLASGRRTALEPDAGSAVVLGSGADTWVATEAHQDGGPRLRVLALDGTRSRDLGSIDAAARLAGDPGFSPLGLHLPANVVLLTGEGGLPGVDDRTTTAVRSIDDGRTDPFDEVTR